jgi:uncharacterized damage-inducible protein DinB
MNFTIQALTTIRQNCLKLVEDLSAESMHVIPKGYNNHIAWHLGHMVTSQQLLCYARAKAPLLIPEEYMPLFRKGSSPKEWSKPVNIEEIKKYFAITSERFESDLNNGILNNYEEYPTSSGVVLKTIHDAIIYNYGHENLHYGNIMTMKRLIS